MTEEQRLRSLVWSQLAAMADCVLGGCGVTQIGRGRETRLGIVSTPGEVTYELALPSARVVIRIEGEVTR